MKTFLREFVVILVLGIALFFLIQTAVQSSIVVYSSMEPNLHPGQRLIINKIVYRFHEPERGDVIVFPNPNNPDEDFIKRIVGLSGEAIEIKDGAVYINGLRLDEPYIKDPHIRPFPEQNIPEDNYFVLGDNRNNSTDSRAGWTVFQQDIVGQAWLSTWPPSEWGLAPNYSPTLIAVKVMSSYLPLLGVAWRGWG